MKGYVVGNIASKGMDPHRVHLESYWRAAKVPDTYHSIFEAEILDDGTGRFLALTLCFCCVVVVVSTPHTRAHCFAQRKQYLGTRRDVVSNSSPPILRLCICLWYETPSITRDHASPTCGLHFVQGPAVTDANDFSGRSAASAPPFLSDSGTSAHYHYDIISACLFSSWRTSRQHRNNTYYSLRSAALQDSRTAPFSLSRGSRPKRPPSCRRNQLLRPFSPSKPGVSRYTSLFLFSTPAPSSDNIALRDLLQSQRRLTFYPVSMFFVSSTKGPKESSAAGLFRADTLGSWGSMAALPPIAL